MMKRVLLVVTILLGSILIPLVGIEKTMFIHRDSIIADDLPISIFEYSHFESAPEFHKNGTVDEFNSTYIVDSAGKGTVTLNWTHEAGTELNRQNIFSYPECSDFIFFSYNISYPYETKPDEVIAHFDYRANLSGDFLEQEGGDMMFRIYIWIVDSSGNWNEVYTSSAPYTSSYETRVIDFSYFDIVGIFDGMIQTGGIQEDPTDTLSLRIGIAPTSNFFSYLGEEPYMTYNGSVVLQTKSFQMIAYGDLGSELDKQTHIDMGNYSIDGYMPSYGDIASVENGSIYLSASIGNSETNKFNSIISKWTNTCQPVWQITHSGADSLYSSALCVDSLNNVYEIGTKTSESSTVCELSKIDANGNIIYELSFWDSSYPIARGVDICIGPDGYLYGLVILSGESEGITSSIWKWNTDGVEQNHIMIDDFVAHCITALTDYIYLASESELGQFSYSGTSSWIRLVNVSSIDYDSSENIFCAGYDGNFSNVTKWDSSGSLISTFRTRSLYYESTEIGSLKHPSIDVAHDDKVALVATCSRLWPYNVLYKLDNNLLEIWNKTIDLDCYLSNYPNQPLPIVVGLNGNSYIGGWTILNEHKQVSVLSYQFTDSGNLPPPISVSSMSVEIMVVAASLGVIIIVSALIIVSKKSS